MVGPHIEAEGEREGGQEAWEKVMSGCSPDMGTCPSQGSREASAGSLGPLQTWALPGGGPTSDLNPVSQSLHLVSRQNVLRCPPLNDRHTLHPKVMFMFLKSLHASFAISMRLCCVDAKWLQSCPTLRPHGLQPARLLCPWDSPGKSPGMGHYALLQGIFLTQGLNLCLSRLLYWPAGYLGRPYVLGE